MLEGDNQAKWTPNDNKTRALHRIANGAMKAFDRLQRVLGWNASCSG